MMTMITIVILSTSFTTNIRNKKTSTYTACPQLMCRLESVLFLFLNTIKDKDWYILQQWNLRKRIEHFVRVFFMMQDRHGVSVVPAKQYADRFRQRVVKELIYDATVATRPTPGQQGGDDIISMTDMSPAESLQAMSPRPSINPFPNLELLTKTRTSAVLPISVSPRRSNASSTELGTPASISSGIGTPEEEYNYMTTPATTELRLSSLPA